METHFFISFARNGRIARVIKSKNVDGTYLYEIRCRFAGYNVAVSAADLRKAKKLFINATKPENIGKYAVRGTENFKLGV